MKNIIFPPTLGPGRSLAGSNAGEPPIVFFDDFLSQNFMVVAANDTTTWDIYKSHGSAGLVDRHGGWVKVTGTGTDNQYTTLQLAAEVIDPSLGLSWYFETRVELTATSASDVFIGLTERDLGLPNNAAPAGADMVGFALQAGVDWMAVSSDGSGGADGTTYFDTDTGVDQVAATAVVLAVQYDAGADVLTYYINGVKKVTQAGAFAFLPLAACTWAAVHVSQDGSAAQTINLDYVYIEADRA